VYTNSNGSFGYMDLTQAANAPHAAIGTNLSSFATSYDQHWVYLTGDGHIWQIVYTYSNGSFGYMDLTQAANAPFAAIYGGLSSFATATDQHWVFMTNDGHVHQIVLNNYNKWFSWFSNDDLTHEATAPAATMSGLGAFATGSDQHWVFQTNDGHVRQIVLTYSTGGFRNDDLTRMANAPAYSFGDLSAFATATEQHWVFQSRDGHVRQIVFTYSTGAFSNDDLTQRANAPLSVGSLGSFGTTYAQNWVFQTSDAHIHQIVYQLTGHAPLGFAVVPLHRPGQNASATCSHCRGHQSFASQCMVGLSTSRQDSPFPFCRSAA
jgi:hypothetical protein